MWGNTRSMKFYVYQSPHISPASPHPRGSQCQVHYYAVQGASNFRNESYWAILSCGAVYYAVQGGSNFWVCGWNPKVCPFKWKPLSSTFWCCCSLQCTLYKVALPFESVDEILVWPFKWKLLSSTFLWCCLLCCTRWFNLLSLWMKSLSDHLNESYWENFPVMLFIMLFKVVLTFEFVDEILKCDHSSLNNATLPDNKSYFNL